MFLERVVTLDTNPPSLLLLLPLLPTLTCDENVLFETSCFVVGSHSPGHILFILVDGCCVNQAVATAQGVVHQMVAGFPSQFMSSKTYGWERPLQGSRLSETQRANAVRHSLKYWRWAI